MKNLKLELRRWNDKERRKKMLNQSGLYHGMNKSISEPVFINYDSLPDANKFIIATTGGGKSASVRKNNEERK